MIKWTIVWCNFKMRNRKILINHDGSTVTLLSFT